MVAADTLDTLVSFIGGLGGTVLFLTPGYVLGKVYGRNVKAPPLEGTAFIASSAIGGLITHLAMLWWTIPLARGVVHDVGDEVGFLTSAHYIEIGFWFLTVLLIVPAFLGMLFSALTEANQPDWWARLIKRLGFAEVLRTGLAWDWKFAQLSKSGHGAWLRIRLKDNAGIIVGPFGPNSIASSDRGSRDIYLERVWRVDADGEPVEKTKAGMWIAGDEILSIEFF